MVLVNPIKDTIRSNFIFLDFLIKQIRAKITAPFATTAHIPDVKCNVSNLRNESINMRKLKIQVSHPKRVEKVPNIAISYVGIKKAEI